MELRNKIHCYESSLCIVVSNYHYVTIKIINDPFKRTKYIMIKVIGRFAQECVCEFDFTFLTFGNVRLTFYQVHNLQNISPLSSLGGSIYKGRHAKLSYDQLLFHHFVTVNFYIILNLWIKILTTINIRFSIFDFIFILLELSKNCPEISNSVEVSFKGLVKLYFDIFIKTLPFNLTPLI